MINYLIGNKRIVVVIIIGLTLALIGILLIKETTRHGASLRADSFYYLSGADGIASGNGFFQRIGDGSLTAITHFPPMFSTAIAIIKLVGLPAYSSARVLNGLLFGGLILFVGFSIYLSSHSILFTSLSEILILTSPVLIELHSWVLSEPLYLTLIILSLTFLALYLIRPQNSFLLWVAGLSVGLVMLTRYVGLTVLVVGVIGILTFRNGNIKRKIHDAITFSLISVVPLVGFLLRNWVITGNPVNRVAPYWHPPGDKYWEEIAHVVSRWFVPEEILSTSLPIAIAIVCLLTTVIALVYYRKVWGKHRDTGFAGFRDRYLFLLLMLVIITLIVLTVNNYLFDILTPVNNRIYSAIYLSWFLILILMLSGIFEFATRKGKCLILVILGLLILNQVCLSTDLVDRLRQEPEGYAEFWRRSSPTIKYIRSLPDVEIFSNDIQWIYFWGGHMATGIPTPYNPAAETSRDITEYRAAISNMHDRIVNDGALLIVIGPNPEERFEPEHLADVTRGLQLVVSFKDGLVYRAIQPASE